MTADQATMKTVHTVAVDTNPLTVQQQIDALQHKISDLIPEYFVGDEISRLQSDVIKVENENQFWRASSGVVYYRWKGAYNGVWHLVGKIENTNVPEFKIGYVSCNCGEYFGAFEGAQDRMFYGQKFKTAIEAMDALEAEFGIKTVYPENPLNIAYAIP